MSQTKKLLVPFDPEKPEAPSSDFLIPVRAEGRVALRGMASGNEQPYGLMVYLGRAITENDLLRRLVNSPVEIENMDEMLAALRSVRREVAVPAYWKRGSPARTLRTASSSNSWHEFRPRSGGRAAPTRRGKIHEIWYKIRVKSGDAIPVMARQAMTPPQRRTTGTVPPTLSDDRCSDGIDDICKGEGEMSYGSEADRCFANWGDRGIISWSDDQASLRNRDQPFAPWAVPSVGALAVAEREPIAAVAKRRLRERSEAVAVKQAHLDRKTHPVAVHRAADTRPNSPRFGRWWLAGCVTLALAIGGGMFAPARPAKARGRRRAPRRAKESNGSASASAL